MPIHDKSPEIESPPRCEPADSVPPAVQPLRSTKLAQLIAKEQAAEIDRRAQEDAGRKGALAAFD